MTVAIKGLGNISAFTTAGAEVPPNKVKQAGPLGCTLANGTTYYFPIGQGDQSICAENPLGSANLWWAAAVVAVFTLELSDFPKFDESGAVDVTDWSATAGEWTPTNPSTAVVDVSGAGNSASAATVTTGGANIGSAFYDVGNLGARRARIKAVVTTGGVVRCGVWAKGPRS